MQVKRGENMENSAQKTLYTMDELLRVNGGPIPMSRAGIYLMVRQGKMPSVKIGRRVFVPSWYVDSILNAPQ